jgi:hypothetical protein
MGCEKSKIHRGGAEARRRQEKQWFPQGIAEARRSIRSTEAAEITEFTLRAGSMPSGNRTTGCEKCQIITEAPRHSSGGFSKWTEDGGMFNLRGGSPFLPSLRVSVSLW